MALKLLALLAVFAACGSVHAQQVNVLCSRYCNGFQGLDSSSRSTSQGDKHHSSRSGRHLAPTSRQDPSHENFCSKHCGVMKRSAKRAGAQLSKQGGSGIFGQFPFNVLPFGGGESSDGSGSSGFGSAISGMMEYPGQVVNGVFGGGQPGGSGSSQGFPFNVLPFGGGESSDGSGSPGFGSAISGMMDYPRQVVNGVFGGGQPGGLPFGIPLPFNNLPGGQSSGSGSESSGSGSEPSGGGSFISGIMEYPQGIINGVLGGGSSGGPGFPFNMLPFGGSSGGQSSDGSGSSGGSGSSAGGSASSAGGSSSSDGEADSSGGLGFLGITELPGENVIDNFGQGLSLGDFGSSVGGSGSGQNLVSMCEELCGYVVPNSKSHRLPASGRKGSPHGRKARRGRIPSAVRRIAAQSSRQAGSTCPDFCNTLSEFTGSGGSTDSL